MTFFSQISPLLSEKQSIQVVITKNKDQTLTVSVIPKLNVDDEAVKKIKPLNATGTPEQMDVHLANQIAQPLKASLTLADQISEFEDHLKVVKKDTKMKEGEKKDGEAKADKVLKEVDKLVEKKGFVKALHMLEECKKAGYRKTAVAKKLKEVQELQKKLVPDIFTGTGPQKETSEAVPPKKEEGPSGVKETPVEAPKTDKPEPGLFQADSLIDEPDETGPAL